MIFCRLFSSRVSPNVCPFFCVSHISVSLEATAVEFAKRQPFFCFQMIFFFCCCSDLAFVHTSHVCTIAFYNFTCFIFMHVANTIWRFFLYLWPLLLSHLRIVLSAVYATHGACYRIVILRWIEHFCIWFSHFTRPTSRLYFFGKWNDFSLRFWIIWNHNDELKTIKWILCNDWNGFRWFLSAFRFSFLLFRKEIFCFLTSIVFHRGLCSRVFIWKIIS